MKLWKGNVFTPVCHSVQRGGSCPGGLCPGGFCPGGLCPGRSLSGGLCPGGVSVQVSLCLGGSLSRRVSVHGVSVWEDLCPGALRLEGSLSQGSLSRGSLSEDPWYCKEPAVQILLECILVCCIYFAPHYISFYQCFKLFIIKGKLQHECK